MELITPEKEQEIRKKYLKEIEERESKDKILIKFYESFKKFQDKYKNLTNVLKAVEKETGIQSRVYKNVAGDKNIYIEDLRVTIHDYSQGDYLKGILREITQDYVLKLKKELNVLSNTIIEYNKAISILNNIKDTSPQIEKVEYTLREPEIHYKDVTYFLKDFLPLLKEI